MQARAHRVLGHLQRQGVIESNSELPTVDDEFAEREPAMSALARASMSRRSGSAGASPVSGSPSHCATSRVSSSSEG
jgi:hypothetical protein